MRMTRAVRGEFLGREKWGNEARDSQFRAILRVSSSAALLCALTACVGTPVVTASASGCSSLVPPDWSQGVEGAPLPEGNTVGDWIVFGDAQTGKLDVANGRTKDAIGIVSRCEERDKAAVKRGSRGFFGRLFG